MLSKFGDNHMNPPGGVFKSSPHALLKKSKMTNFLLGGANDRQRENGSDRGEQCVQSFIHIRTSMYDLCPKVLYREEGGATEPSHHVHVRPVMGDD